LKTAQLAKIISKNNEQASTTKKKKIKITKLSGQTIVWVCRSSRIKVMFLGV
jgi:hypothetical protein